MGSSTLDVDLAASLLSASSTALHREPQAKTWTTSEVSVSCLHVMTTQLSAYFVPHDRSPQMSLYCQKNVSRAVSACVRFTFSLSFFLISEIPLCNPNLHIKILLYRYELKMLHHLKSILTHLLRAKTGCNNYESQESAVHLKKPFWRGNQYQKASFYENLYWPKFQKSEGIVQCAAKAMLVVSSQSSASCVALLICAWRVQAGLHNPVKIYPSHM